MIDGLFFYEIAMLVLGVILFVVLVVCLVVQIVRSKPFLKLLPFFLVAIIMIGFPAIKSIEFDKNKIKIEKETRDLRQEPTNGGLRAQLSRDLENVAARPSSDASTVATVADAQFALGRRDEALKSVVQAERLNPTHPQVVALQKRIEMENRAAELAAKVEQEPANIQAKQALKETVAELPPAANPLSITTLARAQEALGNHDAARLNLEKALKISPNLQEAIQLKNKIEPR